MITTTTLTGPQAGQDYVPDYPVPALRVGEVIAGRTVIAAIRERDCPGLLPGLHVVTAYAPSPRESMPWVTWSVAYQVDAGQGGRWVASAGHYFTGPRDALADMVGRAGQLPEGRCRTCAGRGLVPADPKAGPVMGEVPCPRCTPLSLH